MQSSCFCNNFFLSFIENYVSFNRFKTSLIFIIKKKCEAELRNIFFSEFQMVTAWCMSIFDGIRDPLKQNVALQFWRNRNKDVYILTETHINWNQIHHIRNDWLGVTFFCPGASHTKGLLVLLHLGLKVSLMLTLIQKGSFCPSRLLTPMTEFSVFMPLQGIAPRTVG